MPFFNEFILRFLFAVAIFTIDEKFTNINKNFVKEFVNAKHEIIPNAGHNIHSEKEEEYISVVTNFLINFF